MVQKRALKFSLAERKKPSTLAFAKRREKVRNGIGLNFEVVPVFDAFTEMKIEQLRRFVANSSEVCHAIRPISVFDNVEDSNLPTLKTISMCLYYRQSSRTYGAAAAVLEQKRPTGIFFEQLINLASFANPNRGLTLRIHAPASTASGVTEP